MNDCYGFPPPSSYLCALNVELNKENDSIATQFYIAVGIISGVGLLLLVMIIGLFVKLHKFQTGYVSQLTAIDQDRQLHSPHIDSDVTINDGKSSQSSESSASEYDPAEYRYDAVPLASAPKKVSFFPRIHLGFEAKLTEMKR